MNYYQVLLFVLLWIRFRENRLIFGFLGKMTSLVYKDIGLWNRPLAKCIK